MKKKLFTAIFLLLLTSATFVAAKQKDYVPEPYTWTSPSRNSSESMPCGGHDVGMNVWVENGDILVYITRSGFFDENNTLLKAGRLRLHIDGFRMESQTLSLDEGCIYINGSTNSQLSTLTSHLSPLTSNLSPLTSQLQIRLWADVHNPVVFATLSGKNKVNATLSYETWRYKDRIRPTEANQQDSWKWLKLDHDVITTRDSILAKNNSLTFFHQNPQQTVFDYTVTYEHLDDVKSQIYNPIGGLRFGGILSAPDFHFTGTSDGKYASTDYRSWNYLANGIKSTTIRLDLTLNRNAEGKTLAETPARLTAEQSLKQSARWWHSYWQHSFIKSDTPEAAHVLRNYELFRYMLGCNAYGEWPTKYNGGLFCFDPVYVQEDNPFTPDFRCWGGGTMTAQNQRLVYWPMLKSGDVDMMASQFDTYLRMLPSAIARTKYYWHHDGACFEEQIDNCGLPNPAEYGEHKEGDDISHQNNLWLEYTYDTALEFCQMILMANEYTGMDIDRYKPLITNSLTFFDKHYQQFALQRGCQALTDKGKLIIYPGSGAETFKIAYNPSSTVAGLRYVLETIDRKHGGLAAWGLDTAYLSRVPEIPMTLRLTDFGKRKGQNDYEQMIAPAETWQRINNVETTELYPVFPWRIYGLGLPDLETARNTYYDDPWALEMRSSRGWKQDNIWAPLLGDEKGSKRLCLEKFQDGPYRFPAFWEKGFDWAPDHNRGGSAMIGLEEMLLQEKPDGELMVFPCWPKEWNCEYRLKATGNRTVEATFAYGHVNDVKVGSNGSKDVKVNRPLRVSILGDSYSTFEGCIPEDNEPWYYYPGHTSEKFPGCGKDPNNNVDRPDQTWWHQTVEALDTMAYRLGDYSGAMLEKNDAYSGATIGYTGYIDNATGKHADYKPRSFITRAPRLGNPDLILVCGATNDSWDGEEIGEFKYADWQEADLYTFRPAMAKFCTEMQRLYPKARIVFIINCDLKDEITSSIHTICQHYNMEYMDLHDIEKQDGHPSRKGMKAFCSQVIDYLHK